MIGGMLSQYVAPFFLNKIAGLLFIIFGFMYIVKP
jgi:putative Ca2+/H+ antiporter (TMEM165/GDT1 family)